jgi:hypothetical protein
VITAHWIDKRVTEMAVVWELKMSIIRFLRMKSHTGKCLGQALFKVCERVGIEKKVSGYRPVIGPCNADSSSSLLPLTMTTRLAMSLWIMHRTTGR